MSWILEIYFFDNSKATEICENKNQCSSNAKIALELSYMTIENEHYTQKKPVKRNFGE